MAIDMVSVPATLMEGKVAIQDSSPDSNSVRAEESVIRSLYFQLYLYGNWMVKFFSNHYSLLVLCSACVGAICGNFIIVTSISCACLLTTLLAYSATEILITICFYPCQIHVWLCNCTLFATADLRNWNLNLIWMIKILSNVNPARNKRMTNRHWSIGHPLLSCLQSIMRMFPWLLQCYHLQFSRRRRQAS